MPKIRLMGHLQWKQLIQDEYLTGHGFPMPY